LAGQDRTGVERGKAGYTILTGSCLSNCLPHAQGLGIPGRRVPRGRVTILNSRLDFISRNRYAFLSLLLVLLMLSHLSNRRWEGDFWEHAACVRELATHPLSPRHPMLPLDASHTFYTPYALFVALLARATGLGAIAALSMAGIFNLLLLLVSLKVFISSFAREDAEKTAFYALLFMLFLWGPPPWTWSGFLHMNVLGTVLPYSSTFSAALMFFSFAIYLRILSGASSAWFVALAVAIPTLLLSHPTTAVVLCAGLAAFTVGSRGALTRSVLLPLAGVFALSGLAALFHPYYSFTDLFLAKSGAVHEDSYDLYENVLPRMLPSLIGVVPLLGRLGKDRRDPLVAFFTLLVCVYAYGALSGKSGYGRVVFYIAFLLQLALAARIARAETQRDWKPFALLAAYLCVTAPSLPVRSLRSVAHYMPGRGSNYSDLHFLSRDTKQYDVILSDPATGCMVPAMGGKVVAYDRYAYWVEDHAARRRDVRIFFSDTASRDDRLEILKKHRVTHILLNTKGGGGDRIADALLSFGDVAYRGPRHLLIRVDERKLGPHVQREESTP